MTLGELVRVLGGKLVDGSTEYGIDGVENSGAACPSDLVFAEDPKTHGTQRLVWMLRQHQRQDGSKPRRGAAT